MNTGGGGKYTFFVERPHSSSRIYIASNEVGRCEVWSSHGPQRSMTPCSLLRSCQRFGGIRCLHFQSALKIKVRLSSETFVYLCTKLHGVTRNFMPSQRCSLASHFLGINIIMRHHLYITQIQTRCFWNKSCTVTCCMRRYISQEL